jgi:hypothetical protein
MDKASTLCSGAGVGECGLSMMVGCGSLVVCSIKGISTLSCIICIAIRTFSPLKLDSPVS